MLTSLSAKKLKLPSEGSSRNIWNCLAEDSLVPLFFSAGMSTAFCKLFSEFLLHINESATTGDRTSNTITAVRRNEERGEQPEPDSGSCVGSSGLSLPSSLCGSQGCSPPCEATHWTSAAPRNTYTPLRGCHKIVCPGGILHPSRVRSVEYGFTKHLSNGPPAGVTDVTMSQAEPSPQIVLPWESEASPRKWDVNLEVRCRVIPRKETRYPALGRGMALWEQVAEHCMGKSLGKKRPKGKKGHRAESHVIWLPVECVHVVSVCMSVSVCGCVRVGRGRQSSRSDGGNAGVEIKEPHHWETWVLGRGSLNLAFRTMSSLTGFT